MKKKILIFFVLTITVILSAVFFACKDDEPLPDQPEETAPLTPADETFLFDLLGADKNASDATVKLMPAPYGDSLASLNTELLSLTADHDKDSDIYSLYYCVKESTSYTVYKTISQDGITWDFNGSKERYVSSDGVATVIAGNPGFYVENSGELRLKSLDGAQNIPLGLSGSVCSAFFANGKYLIYAVTESGITNLCIVQNNTPSVTTIEDNIASSYSAGKYVFEYGNKYLSLNKRSANGSQDFTASYSLDGKAFSSFNGAYIAADRDPASSNGMRQCSRFVANGAFDVVSDNANQDKSFGVYLYEVKDGVTTLRLFKLRQGGVAALYGNLDGATVTTANIQAQAVSLILNYQTGAAGYIDLELLNKNGTSVFNVHIPRGNYTAHNIALSGEAISALGDGAVIKMRLYDAYLYDIRAEG